MDQLTLNKKLELGDIEHPGMFPHLEQLQQSPYIFDVDFGLASLPKQPGILLIRGARQYGKSTWLEQSLRDTIVEFGAGTAFYLNGDMLLDAKKLEQGILDLLTAFSTQAAVKRIFIDEITAVPNWEIVLKRLADQGKLKDILLITTGSNALDLRRGTERLPGRKGKLARTNYLFTPISYKEFYRVCHSTLSKDTLFAYLLSGGSPLACAELASLGYIPEYVIELVRDWVDGEITRSSRNRSSLYNVMNVVFKFAGTPVGQAKLAREAGLANNTVADGYIGILNDLGIITPSYPWDADKNIRILRRPCKYHVTNLLVGITYFSGQMRSVADFQQLPPQQQGYWVEWLVAQELLRRLSISGDSILDPQAFWQSKMHEVDFVLSENQFLEVKRGTCSSLEFAWFSKVLPRKQLLVINNKAFASEHVRGISLEEFLLGG